jgi:hypothetical protein
MTEAVFDRLGAGKALPAAAAAELTDAGFALLQGPAQGMALGALVAAYDAAFAGAANEVRIGSILHEHGANRTERPRRSIQGAFVRRTLATPGGGARDQHTA